jgi:hypothetical protein
MVRTVDAAALVSAQALPVALAEAAAADEGAAGGRALDDPAEHAVSTAPSVMTEHAIATAVRRRHICITPPFSVP